ncbi:hypothetical protein FCU16_09025, partial [Campylobacter jejuni]|nr:hypothetical protein [Campylobacter jejuni]
CVCEFKTVYDVYLYSISISEVFISSKNQDYTFNLTLQVNKAETKICDLGLGIIKLFSLLFCSNLNSCMHKEGKGFV